MVSRRTLCWIAAAAFSPCASGHAAPLVEPLPSDPLELATGPIQPVGSAALRQNALELLGRARRNYTLALAGQAYKLSVKFTVNSGGQTGYDGVWWVNQTFDPQQGLHWTAESDAGYTFAEISANGRLYSEGTPGYIPLRLHEARAALFDAIPSAGFVTHAGIRTSTATFHGTGVTCVLISGSRGSAAAPARRWDETEDCIDPQSGLLMVHSQVPGRYYAYDYTNAPQFAGHVFPRGIIVTEGGKTVSRISVDRLEPLASSDPSLFIPTGEMQQRGRAIAMAGTLKVSRDIPMDASTSAATAHIVCVFGLLTASGDFVEAHSLQPSDPFSAAAVAAARQMHFAPPQTPGEVAPPPQQHFVFVIERFVPAE
jgi:hypothetical protein